MASDDYYDSSDLDDEIYRFERRQSLKPKQKFSKSRYSISWKTLRSDPALIKQHCYHHSKTPKAPAKPYHPRSLHKIVKAFDCDKAIQKRTIDASEKSSFSSKRLEEKSFEDFNEFRFNFYCVMRKSLQSAFENYPGVKICNIRFAPVNESVQNDFMKQLNSYKKHFPQLVYHGTNGANIESILRYGFLIPNRVHPTNPNAPIIKISHGQAYGAGVYSCYEPTLPLGYCFGTNTILACAALPRRDNQGGLKNIHGTILVTTREVDIIPLFLVDVQRLDAGSKNYPHFYVPNSQSQDEEESTTDPNQTNIIPRKYLRKILKHINDTERRKNRYQIRAFED